MALTHKDIDDYEEMMAQIAVRESIAYRSLCFLGPCVCEEFAEQRKQHPTCMAFWCPIHDDIEGKFRALESE